ncbi:MULTISPECIES: fructose-1,6-bisphosphatase [unclassified Fusibacter]|uniref:fructose-1,6-bisphosphatase n=1 Tax=unclassified Fusibacter TaxID=2624464 RepID=UPI001011537A|nr:MULTISPECIES: fructose-1,6-bisphosphatase [unclassified Fusibacter]MCK8060364.1 fructose-1,6-bisphosphatase [Fusibacter sp. A2]NPE20347.1 fructose-1,6-bisphosphatase [Fusibacter sp. A1]RXV63553.1 fructose-1,6-bisphosphatase [Fusibacter sp. A1]
MKDMNLKYLELLGKQYRNISDVCTEIVNLTAITNLPKGTEHFLADIHGEHEAFEHVMRNASGVVKRKINEVFAESITDEEKKTLATLIYYPKEKIKLIKSSEADLDAWYELMIYRLVNLCKAAAYKYTRSKVRKAIPESFKYIIEELFNENDQISMKKSYFKSIVESVIAIDRADEFIITISGVIRQLVVDHLHIIGDIYDRGAGAHHVIDTLMRHHSVDTQWGNHDVLWIGAAFGSEACMANVLRISLRYGNLETLEEGYGINLSPLVRLALDHYGGEYAGTFDAKVKSSDFKEKDIDLMSRMQKAIAIIQFKLEGQIIRRRPDLNLNDRLLLEKIDYRQGTVLIDGVDYELIDKVLPTIDPEDPYRLTEDERDVVEKLKSSFYHSTKLQEHAKFLIDKGSMYLVYNGNLLYHGCIPLNGDGSFRKFEIDGATYQGKSLLDYFDAKVKKAYYAKDEKIKSQCQDLIWYLWCGEFSPLFGKKKMATFERYFIEDSETHLEVKDPYYTLREDEEICDRILHEFGLENRISHIINGHVPVKVKKGEVPIKAGGKLITIDGGFSKAYQKETGIAGYTLIFNSKGMILVSHEPFESKEKAVKEEMDMLPTTVFIQKDRPRMYVGDTDTGIRLKEDIDSLKALLDAYREGQIKAT